MVLSIRSKRSGPESFNSCRAFSLPCLSLSPKTVLLTNPLLSSASFLFFSSSASLSTAAAVSSIAFAASLAAFFVFSKPFSRSLRLFRDFMSRPDVRSRNMFLNSDVEAPTPLICSSKASKKFVASRNAC